MSIVSDNMKYLRKLHGLTQDQFARRVGIKRASVGAYEEQRANPNIDVLKAMSKLFSVSVDDLLKKDLRKIRETPNLIPMDKPSHTPLVAEPTPTEPQTLSSIFEQYYTPSSTSRPAPTVVAAPKPVVPPEPPKIVATPPPVFQTPSFNNVYENTSGAHINQTPTIETEKSNSPTIQYVRRSDFKNYADKFNQGDYLKRLPTFQFPLLAEGTYRAFESGEDFVVPRALLVGHYINNWYDIADGKIYIMVARNLGVVCRRVYNQVKIKGTLLLSSDNASIPTFEVPLKDVMEVWEIKAFFSTVLPEPTVSLDHLKHLVNQMQEELNRIKK
ncbi:helix-turn-helix transcriptional regulator [Runella sp. MFBS21]|uniref:helix-turn-helix domain-containing protein n=1 Tax=Runella sp. MFBS21 TaxID=3034018 RepID=UPI0023F7BAF0|nr:helix-turn-helix transcriptional regulator [Runella sp. MFBS21]MDF7818054.1 helix-turn-helix transcriptional regulator [Runella sp. MFBS21]